MNIYKPKTNRKQEKERLLLLRYRDEFCLGNEKGGSYLRTMIKLKPLIDPERKRK